MKKYIVLYVLIAVMLLTGFVLYTNAININSGQEIDYVQINRIIKLAAINWDNLEKMRQEDLIYRFVIFSGENTLLYASDENIPDNSAALIKSGFLPMDISNTSNTSDILTNNAVIGKVYIEIHNADESVQTQAKLAGVIFAAFALLCLFNLIFLLTIHRILIKPFKRLESFAHKISSGKFDEPLPMDKNNIFGLFTQSFDVMREFLLEEHRNRLKAEQAKKELIASLSHDIKTPVTSIRLISELLQATSTDSRSTEKLMTIEAKAEQIDRLISDLLNSALEELGELKVEPEAVDSAVLCDIFRNADYLSKVRVPENIPSCLIEIDVMRIEQVIENIISNSYKYAGTDIDIDFKIYGELLQVDISDYGVGTDNEALELIFMKFYRGENAKTSQKEGEGLGLYIAKLLMEKMGGGIEAFNRDDDSNRNGGFTVRILIKLSR